MIEQVVHVPLPLVVGQILGEHVRGHVLVRNMHWRDLAERGRLLQHHRASLQPCSFLDTGVLGGHEDRCG